MKPEKTADNYDRIATWWRERHAESKYGVAQLQRAQRRLAGLEHLIVADHIHDDGNTRDAERVAKAAGGSGAKPSRAAVRKKIGRAKAIAKNADLGKKLADEDLGEEQLDLHIDEQKRHRTRRRSRRRHAHRMA